MKKLLKKEICGSREQCTGPTGVTFQCKICTFKEVVGLVHGTHWQVCHSHIQVLLKLLKKKAERENADKKHYPNTHLIKFCQLNVQGKVFFPSSLKWNVISPQIFREGM